MKCVLKLIALFLFPIFSFAQNLSDAKTFQKALELAQRKEKFVMLIINPDLPPEMQAKLPPNPALQDLDVAKKIAANFIVFDTKRTDTSLRSILSTYKITRFPAFLFMHPTKDLFHVEYGYSSTKGKYLMMLDKAMLLSKEKTTSDLEKEHLKNPTDLAVLKEFINARKRNGITNNAELIEKYVQGLKISDFNDYETVLFILAAGPYADGSAYKLAYTNRKIVDSIYKKESIPVRTNINNAIISNTMISAVRTRNMMRAQSGASMSRAMTRDYLRGQKSYNTQMLYYYNGIRDTTNYFKLAIQHYDTYYMSLSADSIKKAELKERTAMMERMKPSFSTNIVSKEKMDSIVKANPGNTLRRTETVITSSPSSNYANELNNIAYQFYQKGTKNLNYLSKAMLWSKRAIELNPIWGYYDTLAHVYYAMGIHSEAIATQKIAVDLAKKESNPEYFERTNKEYEKMKNKSL